MGFMKEKCPIKKPNTLYMDKLKQTKDDSQILERKDVAISNM